MRLGQEAELSLFTGLEVRAWGSSKCIEMDGRVLSEERGRGQKGLKRDGLLGAPNLIKKGRVCNFLELN